MSHKLLYAYSEYLICRRIIWEAVKINSSIWVDMCINMVRNNNYTSMALIACAELGSIDVFKYLLDIGVVPDDDIIYMLVYYRYVGMQKILTYYYPHMIHDINDAKMELDM